MEDDTEWINIDDRGLNTDTEAEQRESRPAVGVIARPNNANEIVSTILRSRRAGYETIVYDDATDSLEALTFAEELGAPVVRPRTPERRLDPRDVLTRSSRELGFPGLLYHSNPTEPIDYAASRRALAESDRYAVETREAATVDETPAVLVGIPAYNEETTIGEVVRGARRHADQVLVVDDGSVDDTAARARDAGATVIQHDQNRGYGGALQTTFEEARRCGAEHLVVLDADGQHQPEDVEELVDAQRARGAELVIGSRFAAGARTDLPMYRRIGLGVVNLLTNVSLGVLRPRSRVGDTQSGFRAYDRTAIETLAESNVADDMSASTDILHHAYSQGLDIEEVGVEVSYDVENASSHHPIEHGLTLVNNLILTIERQRPLLALGVPGFASILVGGWVGYTAINAYLTAQTFSAGMALLSGFLSLAGLFACFTGITLHSISTYME